MKKLKISYTVDDSVFTDFGCNFPLVRKIATGSTMDQADVFKMRNQRTGGGLCHTMPINNQTAKIKSRPMCGEIWMCNLKSKDGSVQSGYRPVYILSNDMNNRHSSTLNIIPITSKMNKRKLPVHVELWGYQRFGLKVPSTMMIEQITTVSINDLDKRIGKITDSGILEAICRALTIQFPIMLPPCIAS